MLYNLYQDSRDPKDPKKLELKQQIESKFATTVVESTKFAANMVLGGDGKMVDGIHELHELKIPFFGVNCGTV